jgi:hypothetical protein
MSSAKQGTAFNPQYKRKKKKEAGHQQLTPIILVTQETEIRRIKFRSQPGQIVHKTLSQKTLQKKNRAVGVTQGEGPEFKPQHQKKERVRDYLIDSWFWSNVEGLHLVDF